MNDAPQVPPATPRAAHAGPFHALLRYNLPYWRAYAAGAGLALLFTGVSLGMPLLVRAVVAGFEQGFITPGLLWAYFAGMIAVAAFTGVARYFQRMLMIGASRKFEYDLRNDYFRHIQGLSRGYFQRVPAGDLMARAVNDVNYVREFVGPGVMGTVDMVRVPFTLGLMIWMSPRLTLVALLPLPFVSVLVYFFMRFLQRQSRVVQDIFATVTGRVHENLSGARVVKAYGIADREMAAFGKISEKYMRANIKLVAIMSFAWPLIGMLVGTVVLLVIWRGGRMVIEGALPLADLTAFLIAMVMLAWPLAQFGWVLTLYQRGVAGMNRLLEVFAEEPEIADDPAWVDPEAGVTGGAIVFDHVGFAHGETPVLDDVDFAAPAGATVAIVGPTGAGKSTMVALLTREYDPTAGQVRIDGRDLREIPLHELRSAIGYVPQDAFLFSDTIRANLLLARPDAREEDLRRACEVAQFDAALADMPRGLDTLLGERGINLSGGQKQRLALARAVLRDPRILVLDDALSAVDTHTEERILLRLRAVMAARTSVIISHRVSTVRHADLILVLDEGRVVERGTHADLLALDGLYAAMHRRQQLETELEAPEEAPFGSGSGGP